MATTQKQVKTRIQQKHDTSANWAKATSFVPLKGEIVVYDDLGRIKVGDGTNTVANLKFVDEGIWLPLTGGEISGSLSVRGEDGVSADRFMGGFFSGTSCDLHTSASTTPALSIEMYGADVCPGLYISINGLEHYSNLEQSTSDWIFTGISDTKGTSSTLAASLKCLNDNYLPLSGGTLTGALTATKFTGDASGLTSIPAGKLTGTISIDRLPNLSSKYLSISGGTLTGQLTLSNNGIKFNTNAIKDVTYSTTDLTAGTSTLATNSIYIVYE